MRVLRLIIGVAVIIQSFIARDIIFAIAGFLVVGMAVLNIGCCGTTGCNTPKKYNEPIKETNYEEVV